MVKATALIATFLGHRAGHCSTGDHLHRLSLRLGLSVSVAVAILAADGLGLVASAQASTKVSDQVSTLSTGTTQPLLWFRDGQPTAQARQAVSLLKRAYEDGLQVKDYQPDRIAAQLDAIEGASVVIPDPAQIARVDAQITAAMERFLSDLSKGRVSPRQVHEDFDDAPLSSFDAATTLRDALRNGDLDQAVKQATPKFPLYPLLKEWLARFRQLEHDPVWKGDLALPPGGKLELGQPYVNAGKMWARLASLGDYTGPPRALTSGPAVYDAELERAVRSFQDRHGLTVDGVVGKQTMDALNVKPAQRVRQIELSMERIRWTPLQHGDRLLVVNIPGYTLYGYQTDGKGGIDVQLEMRVVIGRALNHRTPLFDESMRYIEFSPYWNIPPSIARSETVPAIKRNPAYFARNELEFVDGAGQVYREVTPERLSAVLAGKMRIRQRPGPHNALGDVKFVFPNNMNIFMHHTPATELFSRSRRDFSHGCIRVEHPVELARFVLASEPGWTEDRIRSAMAQGKSNTTRLKDPVPVVIAYSTVMARQNGKIHFYPDVYGHDESLAKALAQRS